MRYKLRAVFLVMAIVAIACAWLKRQSISRNNELSKIEEIRKVSGETLFIGDGEHPFGGCGSYQGIIIFVDDCGPSLLKPFRLDCVKRITGIEMKCRNTAKILGIAAEFSSLKDICIENDSPGKEEIIAAIEDLRTKRPLVSVDYWSSKY